MKLCMSVVLHKIFQKKQYSNQGQVTFLMTSSCFNTVIEVKYFYEEIKFPIYAEISL